MADKLEIQRLGDPYDFDLLQIAVKDIGMLYHSDKNLLEIERGKSGNLAMSQLGDKNTLEVSRTGDNNIQMIQSEQGKFEITRDNVRNLVMIAQGCLIYHPTSQYLPAVKDFLQNPNDLTCIHEGVDKLSDIYALKSELGGGGGLLYWVTIYPSKLEFDRPIQVDSDYGEIYIGSDAPERAYFNTDRANFVFNKDIKVNGYTVYHTGNANLPTVDWQGKDLYAINNADAQNLIRAKIGMRVGSTYQYEVYHANNANKSDVSWTCQNLTAYEDVGSETFYSGFAGSGWKLDDTGTDFNFTVDNLFVRKAMTVYELIISKIRATNGSVWVSDCAKVDSVTNLGSGLWRLNFDTDDGENPQPFVYNDFLRCQKWTGRDIKYYAFWVSAVDPAGAYIEGYIVNGSSTPAKDDDLVRIGNGSDTNRQGAVYITASDDQAPFIDVVDGVTSYTLANKTKMRLGKLTGITDSDFGGQLSGYGLYSNSVYLKGKMRISEGAAAGFTITGTELYHYLQSGSFYYRTYLKSTEATTGQTYGRGLTINTDNDLLSAGDVKLIGVGQIRNKDTLTGWTAGEYGFEILKWNGGSSYSHLLRFSKNESLICGAVTFLSGSSGYVNISDKPDVGSPSLGIKINTENWNQTQNGEAYIHGFDYNGTPADIDGYVIYNGAKYTIVRKPGTWTVSLATQLIGKGYIIFNFSSDSFTVVGQAVNRAFCKKENGIWYYDNGTAWTNFTPSSSMLVIGTCTTDTTDHIEAANVWTQAMDIKVVSEAGADMTKTIIDAGVITTGRIELGDGSTIKAGIYGGGIAGTDIRFWAGATYVNRATAPFRVNQDGQVTASAGVIAGWNIVSDAIYYGTKKTTDGYSASGITLAGNGSIHAENFYINEDGRMSIRGDVLVYAYTGVSDTVIISHDTSAQTTSVTYVKLKTITLGTNVKDNRTLRIKFKLMSPGTLGAWGRIYRGGSPVGAERHTHSDTGEVFSEDIAGWYASDTIELWAKTEVSDTAVVMDFRVCGTHSNFTNEVTGTTS